MELNSQSTTSQVIKAYVHQSGSVRSIFLGHLKRGNDTEFGRMNSAGHKDPVLTYAVEMGWGWGRTAGTLMVFPALQLRLYNRRVDHCVQPSVTSSSGREVPGLKTPHQDPKETHYAGQKARIFKKQWRNARRHECPGWTREGNQPAPRDNRKQESVKKA